MDRTTHENLTELVTCCLLIFGQSAVCSLQVYSYFKGCFTKHKNLNTALRDEELLLLTLVDLGTHDRKPTRFECNLATFSVCLGNNRSSLVLQA